MSSPLVSTQWLADHLSAPDVRIVDASWYLPDQKRNAKAEYAEGHIPGAVFFDLDDIADTTSPYPHMLPPPEKFASRMKTYVGAAAFATVTPSPWETKIDAQREYRRIAKSAGMAPSYLGFGSYLNARALIEAVTQTKSPTKTELQLDNKTSGAPFVYITVPASGSSPTTDIILRALVNGTSPSRS